MLKLLLERQADEAWWHSNKVLLFWLLESMGQKSNFCFFNRKSDFSQYVN